MRQVKWQVKHSSTATQKLIVFCSVIRIFDIQEMWNEEKNAWYDLISCYRFGSYKYTRNLKALKQSLLYQTQFGSNIDSKFLYSYTKIYVWSIVHPFYFKLLWKTTRQSELTPEIKVTSMNFYSKFRNTKHRWKFTIVPLLKRISIDINFVITTDIVIIYIINTGYSFNICRLSLQ